MPVVDTIPLHETARERYLTYALSVITSRALPDVRDGLKPVQRRILYAMATNLRLGPDARFRKSATIVGEVMGKYHPHGDTAIYDAMVRMAQDWALRAPLVDGQGNFGSLDGDSPAAMRYTEARLQALGAAMLAEIKQDTVAFRPDLRRPAVRAGRAAGAGPQPARQRRDRDRRRHGDERPAAQPRRDRRRVPGARQEPDGPRRDADEARPGARLPDGRADPEHGRRDRPASTRPARAPSTSAASTRPRARGPS